MAKDDGLRDCKMCGQSADEDGAAYEHAPGGVRVACPCGLATPWIEGLDHAREQWNRLQDAISAVEGRVLVSPDKLRALLDAAHLVPLLGWAHGGLYRFIEAIRAVEEDVGWSK